MLVTVKSSLDQVLAWVGVFSLGMFPELSLKVFDIEVFDEVVPEAERHHNTWNHDITQA